MEELPNTYDLSAEQQNTVTLLERLLGKIVADRYVDFCRLAAGAFSLRVSHPIAAHALRELESTIRCALAVPLEANAPKEADTDRERREEVRKSLANYGFDVDTTNRAVDALKPRIAHRAQIKKIVESLGFASNSDIAKYWLSLQKEFADNAHMRSFHHSLSVNDEFRSKYQQPFDYVIREIALSLQSRYSKLLLRVDEIAAMPDKKEAVNCYKNETGALTLQWHFFNNLKTPDWLPHLAEAGLLGEPIADLDRSSDSVPLGQWPAGKYLLLMAQDSDSSTRKLVIDAIRSVASSKHPEVQQNGIEILAILPPDESAPHVGMAQAWLDRDADFFRLMYPCKNLVTNLAKGGQPHAALNMARELLQLWDQDGEIANLYDHQMYAYFLPEFVDILTKTCGEDALRLFSNLLEQATSISQQSLYMHFSSHPIADDEMANHDICYALIRAVRQSAEVLVQEDAASMRSIITLLTAYGPKVFLRLALHILAKNPKAASDLAESYLITSEFIEAEWCNHEYAELALAWYPSLPVEKQQEVLNVIDALPDKYRPAWKGRFEELYKRQPTESDELTFNAITIRDAVWKWRSALTSERQEILSKIAESQGAPDAWWNRILPNEESPLTEDDLLNRPIVEIVAFLKSWRQGEKPRQQTITALAHKLRQVAERDSKRYAAEADQFSDIAPIYVRHLLDGIKNSVGVGRDIIHENVLKLIQQTFNRMHEPVNELSVTDGDDPNWLWACTAGTELLKAGLGRGANGISYRHVDIVQPLVFGLLEQSPQQPELTDFEDRFKRDAYFGAAATLRGSAVENSILFIFWLSKHQESLVAGAPQNALANMPTLRTLLEKQLEDITPDGRIPRAILGRYLNWLFYLGKDWLVENMSKIFSPTDVVLRQSAWLAHLGHDQGPIKELMPQLLICYGNEIACLDTNGKERDNYYHKRLANYLILMYLWDVLPDSMLELFWQVSSVSLRQHVMWCVGHELGLSPEHVPAKFRARGFQYWERRLEMARNSSDHDAFREEIGAIGQWCSQDQIDSQWLSAQLLAVLKAGYVPNNGYNIVDWLAKVFQANAIRAIEVLEALLESRDAALKNNCMMQRVSIRSILTEGLANGTEDTISRSRALVSILSSRGETGYLDLVQ